MEPTWGLVAAGFIAGWAGGWVFLYARWQATKVPR